MPKEDVSELIIIYNINKKDEEDEDQESIRIFGL